YQTAWLLPPHILPYPHDNRGDHGSNWYKSPPTLAYLVNAADRDRVSSLLRPIIASSPNPFDIKTAAPLRHRRWYGWLAPTHRVYHYLLFLSPRYSYPSAASTEPPIG